jgi:hypothetical protein
MNGGIENKINGYRRGGKRRGAVSLRPDVEKRRGAGLLRPLRIEGMGRSKSAPLRNGERAAASLRPCYDRRSAYSAPIVTCGLSGWSGTNRRFSTSNVLSAMYRLDGYFTTR